MSTVSEETVDDDDDDDDDDDVFEFVGVVVVVGSS